VVEGSDLTSFHRQSCSFRHRGEDTPRTAAYTHTAHILWLLVAAWSANHYLLMRKSSGLRYNT
jgi:hypothetical protein